MTLSDSLVGSRYALEDRLGAGSMGEVYRAHDRLTGKPVALKRVTRRDAAIPASQPDASTDLRLVLAQEFKMLASLRHPHIISVLDYGFDYERQPFFTMELLAEPRTLLEAGKNRTELEKASLLVQMLQALAYLHRRGVLHRDLKPANVLVGRLMTDDGPPQVKVLDFGLSVHQTGQPETEGMIGTLTYMAPEVMMGESATRRSDLYAVGVMACELFTGRHPFEIESTNSIISQVVYNMPVVLLSQFPAMETIILRLLSREAAERYEDAASVIDDLNRAFGSTLTAETPATRESFLQAAPLVGRGHEMTELTALLFRAIDGRGGLALIGGESGVGKSRLLDEMRTVALVRGVRVVRGQSVSEGGSPYQDWREVLRSVVLFTRIDAFEAGVLKALLPDIEQLVGMTAESVPELDPTAAQQRLFGVIETAFRRQAQPLVVMLEDLHWMQSDSLALLKWLARMSDLPLLLIGSYRDDERPALPQSLPEAMVIKLGRLGDDGIAQLSEAMIGEAGRRIEMIELLKRETEGNVFFIIEVVRALAEEAGTIESIGRSTLPKRVMAGGIQTLIGRRLARVPESARSLLQRAAVIGRQLDLTVLQRLAPEMDLGWWLNVCAEAGVIEALGIHWRFAHDKLRDGLLYELSPQANCDLYEQVATTVEAVYAEHPEQAAALAHLWGMAGNTLKQAHYNAVAGQQSLRSGGFQEASLYLESALRLYSGEHLDLMEAARLRRQLAVAKYGLGDLGASQQYLAQAAALLGILFPQQRGEQVRLALRQVARQFGHRAAPVMFIGRARDRERLLEANRICMLQTEIAFFNSERLLMMALGFQAFNLAERAGLSAELARTYANMCYAVSSTPLRFWAETYKKLARQMSDELKSPQVEAFVLTRTSIYDVGMGRWAEVEGALGRSDELAKRDGNPQAQEEVTNLLAGMQYYHGNFATSRALYKEEYDAALHSNNKLHEVWGLKGQGQSLLRLGQIEEALLLLRYALDRQLEYQLQDVVTLKQIYSLLAQAHLYNGQLVEALKLARDASRLAKGTGYPWIEGYNGSAEVFLAAADLEPERRVEHSGFARQMIDGLMGVAKTIPIARPRAALFHGRLLHAAGQPDKALKTWQVGLQAAERLGMVYEQGLLHEMMGRMIPAERGGHLADAARYFDRVGATFELARVTGRIDQIGAGV